MPLFWMEAKTIVLLLSPFRSSIERLKSRDRDFCSYPMSNLHERKYAMMNAYQICFPSIWVSLLVQRRRGDYIGVILAYTQRRRALAMKSSSALPKRPQSLLSGDGLSFFLFLQQSSVAGKRPSCSGASDARAIAGKNRLM